MKIFKYSLIILVFIGLSSCKKKCPEFDKEIMTWIPYEKGDTIKLSNADLDSTLIISIYSQYIDHMDSYKTNEKCGQCDDYIEINEYSYKNNNFYYHAFTSYQKIEGETFSFQFKDYLVSFGTDNSQITERSNYIIEGIEYQNVKIYINEKNFETGFYSLIIAKSIGIVAIIDKDERIWSIDNNELKTVNLNIKSGPC